MYRCGKETLGFSGGSVVSSWVSSDDERSCGWRMFLFIETLMIIVFGNYDLILYIERKYNMKNLYWDFRKII